MSSISRKDRIQELRSEARTLQTQVDTLHKECNALELEQQKYDHPCTCVKLNRDVEIFDMGEQSRRGRTPLSMGGFVADCLSAREDCDTCKGTGIPTKCNHFGEMFCPNTCPACHYRHTHKEE